MRPIKIFPEEDRFQLPHYRGYMSSDLPNGTYWAKLKKSPFVVDMNYRFRPSYNDIVIIGVVD